MGLDAQFKKNKMLSVKNKKSAFTLAEVLITLGIIGVVAAMTLPSFINKAADAKIGPSLAKAVATFDHATKALIYENEYETLLDDDKLRPMAGSTLPSLNIKFFLEQSLNQYMIIEKTGFDSTFLSVYALLSDNIKIIILPGTILLGKDLPPYEQVITNVVVDINGDELPNEVGTDQFYFKLMNDGSLQPYGANGIWKQYCPVGEVPTDPKYCSGHIFENGFKILYE